MGLQGDDVFRDVCSRCQPVISREELEISAAQRAYDRKAMELMASMGNASLQEKEAAVFLLCGKRPGPDRQEESRANWATPHGGDVVHGDRCRGRQGLRSRR